MDKDALIAEITAAFEGVSREGGVSLREGEVLDDYGTEEECAAARLLDTDTRWHDVSDVDLQEYWGAVFFFDAIGFRYYLPAYLIFDLHQNISDKYGFDSDMVSRLYLSSDEGIRDYQLERFSMITPEQGKVVCHFLKFTVMHGYKRSRTEASDALAAYWNRYQ